MSHSPAAPAEKSRLLQRRRPSAGRRDVDLVEDTAGGIEQREVNAAITMMANIEALGLANQPLGESPAEGARVCGDSSHRMFRKHHGWPASEHAIALFLGIAMHFCFLARIGCRALFSKACDYALI